MAVAPGVWSLKAGATPSRYARRYWLEHCLAAAAGDANAEPTRANAVTIAENFIFVCTTKRSEPGCPIQSLGSGRMLASFIILVQYLYSCAPCAAAQERVRERSGRLNFPSEPLSVFQCSIDRVSYLQDGAQRHRLVLALTPHSC